MKAATENLFFRPLTPDNADILMSGDARAQDDGSIEQTPKCQHLTCFAGGMMALGSRLFSNDEHLLLGRKLTDGCIWAYKNGPHHVMPEIAHFIPCDESDPLTCTWSQDRWKQAVLERKGIKDANASADGIILNERLPRGYTSIDDPRYILRPEAIESVFILYRITLHRGDCHRVIDSVACRLAAGEAENNL